MRQVLACFAALLSLLTAVACQPIQKQPAPTPDLASTTEADLKAISNLSGDYGAAVTAGDVDGFLNLFTDDAILLPPYQSMISGKESIRSLLEAAFAPNEESDFEETTTPEEIRITGSWAFDRGITTITRTPKPAGEPTVRYNKYIRIWRKVDGTNWKLSCVIWNPNGKQGPREEVLVTSGGNPTTSETDTPAIQGVLDEYVAALQNGNPDPYAALFTEDAVFMAPGRAALLGRQAIRVGASSFFEHSTEKLEPSIESITIPGDWAHAHGTFSRTLIPNDGDERQHTQGKFLWIFERQSNDTWKIARYIWNYDQTAESPD